MIRRTLAAYGWSGLLTVICIGAILLILNGAFAFDAIRGLTFSDASIFFSAFINVTLGIMLVMPVIGAKVDKMESEVVNRWLGLPTEQCRPNFPAFTTFLSNQALAAFLATILTFTGKSVLHNFGSVVGGIYVGTMLILAIAVASITLVQFVLLFTRYGKWVYGLACFFSVIVMLGFFDLGIKSAP